MTRRLGVAQALAALDTLREYETALLGQEGAAAAREMGLAEHAFQTAEVRCSPRRDAPVGWDVYRERVAATSIMPCSSALLYIACCEVDGSAWRCHVVTQACRLAHPDAEWLQLAGLLHGLGKLLAHPT